MVTEPATDESDPATNDDPDPASGTTADDGAAQSDDGTPPVEDASDTSGGTMSAAPSAPQTEPITSGVM